MAEKTVAVEANKTDAAARSEKAVAPAIAANDMKQAKPDDSKALVPVAVDTETPPPAEKRTVKGSQDRDVALAEVEKGKRLSFIKAWEETEKSKAQNKAQKKLSDVAAWENSKKAALEAKLKKLEENLERKKAVYAEKMKNKVALLHKQAEEKRAMVEAQRGKETVAAEEMAGKYRATGNVPKKDSRVFLMLVLAIFSELLRI